MAPHDVRWIVPPGKEDEYEEDAQGNPIHVKYGADAAMSGTVVPSGKDRIHSGGSHGFTIDDMDIPQNIIAYDAGGQRTITTITRREMIAGLNKAQQGGVKPAEATPEAIAKLGEQAEDVFARIGEATKTKMVELMRPSVIRKAAAMISRQLDPFEEGTMAKKKAKAKKKTAKKRRARNTQRVVESEAPEAQSVEESAEDSVTPPAPAVVKLTGPFGAVAAQFSGVFRDGMCLVLYSDARQLASLYQLPESDEPMVLTVEFNGHVVECIWAGIQFTMPNSPVTFIVLLVEKEQDDGEGQSGQTGLDDM